MLCRMSLLAFCIAGALFAQKRDLAGDYSGRLGPLHLKLHLKDGPNGLEGTLDSPDQHANGLLCANFKLEQKNLSFEVPSVHGNWSGSVSNDGTTLTGKWSQGQEIPLAFTRDEPEGKPSLVDGIWLGTLVTGGPSLQIQIILHSDIGGKEHCTLDSLDQGAMGLPCDNVQFNSPRLTFEVPVVHGRYQGTLSENHNEIKGEWTQGTPLSLNLTRQKTAIAARINPPKFQPALPAVQLADLKALLDKDLTESLQKGMLSPAAHGGVTIGVFEKGASKVLAYGPVDDNSIYEIGSITKTFTGLILAQMVEQKKVTLDEPVRELLPSGTVAKPQGPEITLLDLAIQHSGLPRMPDNFHPSDPQNPYADYSPADLYAFIGKHGVAKPDHPEFLYSNVGVGLLGQALADRAGKSYPELLASEVTGPLGMRDTVVHLSPEQLKRFAPGHTGTHHPAHAWDLDALAGAGAIRSTASDMLIYLAAQLDPEEAPRTLRQAIPMTHDLHADVGPGTKIALIWMYDEKTGNYWHNGATGGYSSYAYFNPKRDTAVVVLCNTTIGLEGSFADHLGEHITQRLTGQPALELQ